MPYEPWPEIIPYSFVVPLKERLNQCQTGILQVLAEIVSTSVYDLKKDKRLHYLYSYVANNVEILHEMGLVETKYDITGVRAKKMVNITLIGMLTHLQKMHLKDRDPVKKLKDHVRKLMDVHRTFFPFGKYWDEIIKTCGRDRTLKGLVETASEMTKSLRLEFIIDQLNIRFDSVVSFDGLLQDHFGLTSFKKRQTKQKRDMKFAKLLFDYKELKNAYIAYLAIQDITSFVVEKKENDSSDSWESEKELAFFEGRNGEERPFFSGERLREFLPGFGTKEYIFTGILVDRLLWQMKDIEKPRCLQRDKFRICVLK